MLYEMFGSEPADGDKGPDARETAIHSDDSSGEQFAIPGDSGSMVTNQSKEWVGIVMSGESTGDTAYMMLAQEIIDDVKARLATAVFSATIPEW